MKKIKLTQGKYALVDDKDYEFLNQWKWHVQKAPYTFYAKRMYRVKGDYKKFKAIYMHNLILNTPEGKQPDHINRNGLDNRRSNLRIVTLSENNFNRKINKNNKGIYKGIYWYQQHQKWMAFIGKNNKYYNLGYFSELEDAIKARLKGEVRFYGALD